MPAFLAAYARAARRAARDADLVHAHWIPSALAARATGKPYVLQVWGTDVELARRAPALVRPLAARRAARDRGVDVPGRRGARCSARARFASFPSGVAIPERGRRRRPSRRTSSSPGRLSEEKGILEFLEATDGLERVIVGDGPLREQVPEAVGFVPPSELGAYYERAAVVCVPSRREGYGLGAREAMAYGRPVVATRVGGLRDLEHVLFVPPGDAAALRSAVERLLGDPGRRAELGEAGRAEASAFSHVAAAERLLAATVPRSQPDRKEHSASPRTRDYEPAENCRRFTTCCHTDGRYGGPRRQGPRTAVD